MTTTNTTTNATINTFNTKVTGNKIADAIIVNRGFSGAKLNAKEFDAEMVKDLHKHYDAIHSACYAVASARYNNVETIDESPIYSALSALYAYIGEVKGAKLRNDENVVNTLVVYASRHAVKKSADLQYVYSQKANSAKYLRELENTNGACAETIEKVKADIEGFDAQIEELKAISGNQYKEFAKSNASAFYKGLEDYLADMIEVRACMTEEEVQAELEAKRQARREKTAQKKKEKKSTK